MDGLSFPESHQIGRWSPHLRLRSIVYPTMRQLSASYPHTPLEWIGFSRSAGGVAEGGSTQAREFTTIPLRAYRAHFRTISTASHSVAFTVALQREESVVCATDVCQSTNAQRKGLRRTTLSSTIPTTFFPLSFFSEISIEGSLDFRLLFSTLDASLQSFRGISDPRDMTIAHGDTHGSPFVSALVWIVDPIVILHCTRRSMVPVHDRHSFFFFPFFLILRSVDSSKDAGVINFPLRPLLRRLLLQSPMPFSSSSLFFHLFIVPPFTSPNPHDSPPVTPSYIFLHLLTTRTGLALSSRLATNSGQRYTAIVLRIPVDFFY